LITAISKKSHINYQPFGGADSDLHARATKSNCGKSHINSTGQRKVNDRLLRI
jgi:hypothetical protein